jgi:parallel beta-helix repeat protein
VVSGNTLDGIRLESTAADNTIQNNLIGTTGDGLDRVDNQRHGVWINGSLGNLVGTNGAGNTISGNHVDGVRVDGGDTAGVNTIAANRIGLTVVPGSTRLGGMPNVRDGIAVFTHDVVIGGDLPGDGNSIGTNGRNGILLGEGSGAATVHGNFVGTDAVRTPGLGNVADGVYIQNSAGNAIGSSDANVPPNVITANRRGVFVTGDAAVNNAILGNSIDLNLGAAGIAGLGIDLDKPMAPGVTANDPGDVDGGPNNLQNYPEFVMQYVNHAGTPTIRWSLDSTANRKFRVEVFAGTSCDPSNFGEGATLLSAVGVWTNVAGAAIFDTPVAVASGTAITTTATQVGANPSTSEFSQCVVVA